MVVYSTNISFDRVDVRPITSSLGLSLGTDISMVRHPCWSKHFCVCVCVCVCACIFIIATSYLYYHFTVFTCSLVRLFAWLAFSNVLPPAHHLNAHFVVVLVVAVFVVAAIVSLSPWLVLYSFHPSILSIVSICPLLSLVPFSSPLLSLCAAQTCFATKRHCFGNLVWLHTECKWDQKKESEERDLDLVLVCFPSNLCIAPSPRLKWHPSRAPC